MEPNQNQSEEIDESLYSRQRLMLGDTAMKKMASSTVFLSGLGGLGIEVAKNVALAGVKNLALNDNRTVSMLDLSTHFYASKDDVGKPRIDIAVPHITALNPYTKISIDKNDLKSGDLSFLANFTCVVLTDSDLETATRVNKFCRTNKVKFLLGRTLGAYGYSFADFGGDFEVVDATGEEPVEELIQNVTQATNAVLTTLANPHGFSVGDMLSFHEVKGMSELNNVQARIIKVDPNSGIVLDLDTSKFGAFSGPSGRARQVKELSKLAFDDLETSLESPTFQPEIMSLFMDYQETPTLHLIMRAIDLFEREKKELPRIWNEQDEARVWELFQQVSSSTKLQFAEKEARQLLRKLSFTARGSIVGMTSCIGGLLAHEVLVALSGKYTPLRQWIHIQCSEVIPDTTNTNNNNDNNEQVALRQDRLDGQRIVLGQTLCDALADARLFMVGVGAIGCEMLKNYAMLGIGTGKGRITVTDNDLIEKSNLNRQFLFRNKDIGAAKSECGARAARGMNPGLQIDAHLDKVGPESENKFSDKFFQQHDLVVNALDNVNARRYVDSRCVTNKRPLLDSGTLGPKGHVQVVVPFKFESYSSRRDPPEKDVPFCTLKSFPNQIEHCIEWARDFSFGGFLVNKPKQWNLLTEEDNLLKKLNTQFGGGIDLRLVKTAAKMISLRPASFDDCVRFARRLYEAYFVNKALQLLHNFPLDHTVDAKGTLFWTSPKRPPKALPFNWSDPLVQSFVLSFSVLWAQVWSITPSKDLTHIEKVCANTEVPKFVPRQKQIETDESKKKEEVKKEDSPQDLVEINLQACSKFFQSEKAFQLNSIEFEKDDDTNFHIDFISACANLRARMFAIEEVDRIKVKAIAGRITPAIATTTAVVSGMASIELIKVIKDCKAEEYRNLWMNLALPMLLLTEPAAPERKYVNKTIFYTEWDQWDIHEGDITLDQFISTLEKRYNLTVGGVFDNAIMVYVPMFHKNRRPMKMMDILKKKPDAQYMDLIVTFTGENDEEIAGPPVRFYFP